MWVLVEPGDVALVPSPSYPIHLFAPVFAGAAVTQVPMGAGEDLFGNVVEAYERSSPRPRALILSFPHNPTGAVVDLELMQRIVDFAREREIVVVHDFAYADIAFDGHEPPSILQAEGAGRGVRRALQPDQGLLDGRAGGSASRSAAPRSSHALGRLKSYLDYGTFQPIQIASIVAMNEASEYPREVCEIYRSRRDALCSRPRPCRLGRSLRPKGTMFVWARDPRALPGARLASSSRSG